MAPGSASAEERIARDVADAQALIRKGKLLEATERLQQKLNHAPSCREKVLWRLATSRMLIDAKQVRLALPHLEQILRDIDAYRLEELSFADGTPFANPETRNWLKGIAFDSTPSAGARTPTVPGSASTEDRIARDVADAQALIRKGKLLEATERLQQKLNHAPSCREKVLWRLAISRMLIDAKQVRLALPHLEQILRDIDAYRLEEYEPALTLEGLKLILTGLESQTDASFRVKTADVLYRIARLDMAEAVRLEKS